MKVRLTPLPHIADFTVSAELDLREDHLLLKYSLSGDISEVSLDGSECEELWRHTCFELFIRDREGSGYEEINCAPDGRFTRTWLSDYREVHSVKEFHPLPKMRSGSIGGFECEIYFFDLDVSNREISVAVITADQSGTRRFWGVNHFGETPDFHHEENFFAFDPS